MVIAERFSPMLAVEGPMPADDERWGYEFKWDGMRAVVYSDAGTVKVLTRSGRDVTAGFPEIAKVADVVGGYPIVLDGEIVALDDGGRPSFEALQPRMNATVRNNSLPGSRRAVSYMVFDLMHFDGTTTISLPYERRRALLERLDLNGGPIATPPSHHAGAATLAASRSAGLEGVVARRLDGPYLPGRRSSTWVKAKLFASREVVIGGYLPGRGGRRQGIGALLVGVPEGGGEKRLRFAGRVGSGFSEAVLADLERVLAPLVRDVSPFADPLPSRDATGAVYVAPQLVGDVRYSEWTRAGRLRQPSWRGLRPDRSPTEVAGEP